MTLGAKIQKLRKSRLLSQEAFADIMKVSRQEISKWELDQSYPEINKLIEMADYFNITLDELLRDNSDEDETIKYKEKEVTLNSTSSPKEIEEVSIRKNYSIQKQLRIILSFVFLFIFIYYGSMTGKYIALVAYVSVLLVVNAVRLKQKV